MSGSGKPAKDDFLITTTVDGKSWHWLWDHNEPMDIDHPALWEIHRDANGAKIVHKTTGEEIEVTAAHLMGREDLELPRTSRDSRDLTIRFKKLQRIRPAYMPDLSAIQNVGKADHYMSAGIREHLINFKEVDGKIVARVEDEKIFDVRAEASYFTIAVHRSGLRFKPTGQTSRPLDPGQKHNFSFTEIYGGAFVYGSYWWRFNKVPTPEMMSLDELDREEATQDVISLKQLGKVILTFMAASVALVVGMHYVEQYQEMHRQKPAAVAVELKKPKIIAAATPVPTPKLVEKPKPSPTPVKLVEKPKPKPKPEPKKPEPPKKVVKKEPPKKPEPKKPEPPKIVKKEPPKAPPPPPVKVPVQPKVAVAPPPPAVKPPPVQPKVPDAAVVAAQQKAAVAKSLNFLSTGPSKAVNALATNPNAKAAQKYSNVGSGAIPANNSELTKMATANTGAGGPITTNSSRTVASGIKGVHGKGLNQVQGKVSLNALYGSGSGEALGAAAGGGGMTVSGPGKLSDAEIEKTLAKYLQKLQFCYEKALLSDSALGGTINIKWTIGANGSVSGQAVTRSEMNNKGLHDCLLREFGKMQFPLPKGGAVEVKKPFKFESSSM